MTPRARTDLDPTASSAKAARDFVRRVLDAWDCDDPDEIALLLTSEVVSNAVLHAATRLALDVDLDDDVLRISVHDGSPRPATMRDPEAGTPGGRGLLLVDSLARRWGSDVEQEGAGKVVWFELAASRRRRPASP